MPRYEQKYLFPRKDLHPPPQEKQPRKEDISSSPPEELVWDPERQEFVRAKSGKRKGGRGYRTFRTTGERLFGKNRGIKKVIKE